MCVFDRDIGRIFKIEKTKLRWKKTFQPRKTESPWYRSSAVIKTWTLWEAWEGSGVKEMSLGFGQSHWHLAGSFFFSILSSQRWFSLLKGENTSRKPVTKSLEDKTSGNNYLGLLLYPSNAICETWRNLMTFETPESGMGLVQKLLEKEHRRKALGKAQNRGKAFWQDEDFLSDEEICLTARRSHWVQRVRRESCGAHWGSSWKPSTPRGFGSTNPLLSEAKTTHLLVSSQVPTSCQLYATAGFIVASMVNVGWRSKQLHLWFPSLQSSGKCPSAPGHCWQQKWQGQRVLSPWQCTREPQPRMMNSHTPLDVPATPACY